MGNNTQFSVQGASNLGLGQAGSAFSDTQDNLTPTSGVFVAITMIEDTTFTVLQSAEGAGVLFIGNTASNAGAGSGNEAIDTSNTFPAGVTIYGRWDSITLNGGSIVAYIG
tara:strand:+ start:310 stop:642 length:333 start_codon:yes stop_codon:yes gene_type:complete